MLSRGCLWLFWLCLRRIAPIPCALALFLVPHREDVGCRCPVVLQALRVVRCVPVLFCFCTLHLCRHHHRTVQSLTVLQILSCACSTHGPSRFWRKYNSRVSIPPLTTKTDKFICFPQVGWPLISKRVQRFVSSPSTTVTAKVSVICSPLATWHDPGRAFTTRLACSTRELAVAVDRAMKDLRGEPLTTSSNLLQKHDSALRCCRHGTRVSRCGGSVRG